MHSVIENLRQAFSAIKENRLRTFMSITGIAVGIAAVMTVGVVSQSGRDYIYTELSSYGLNSLWVYRKWEDDNPFAKQREGTGITSEDYAMLKRKKCCPNVLAISPSVYPNDWMVNLRVGNTFNKSSVEGVDIEYLRVNGDMLSDGRGFSKDEILRKQKVALIGPTASRLLLGENVNPVGRVVYMGDVKLKIIGVLEEKKRDLLGAMGLTQGYDENNRLLIPFTLYQQILGTKDIHTLRAETIDQSTIDQALNEITHVLNRRHNKQYAYKAESMREWINTTNGILDKVSSMGVLAAVVALLVGGIGIFNIMSSSVVERTREIGIRKALGASQKDIMIQFVSESIYISAIGGIVGSLLSGLVLIVMVFFAEISLSAAWGYLIVAIVVSILVGLSAGYIPARNAARMLPAEALRYE